MKFLRNIQTTVTTNPLRSITGYKPLGLFISLGRSQSAYATREKYDIHNDFIGVPEPAVN